MDWLSHKKLCKLGVEEEWDGGGGQIYLLGGTQRADLLYLVNVSPLGALKCHDIDWLMNSVQFVK